MVRRIGSGCAGGAAVSARTRRRGRAGASDAGTRIPRTRVASIRIASPQPMPNICRKLTEPVANAKKVTASRPAAVETMRPVRARPAGTATVRRFADVVQFLDPAEDEDLVVHRQAEGDAEQEHRHRHVHRSRREPEDAAQVSVLEHPGQHAERRGQGQGAEDQRPDRLHHAAGEQEQDDECGQHHHSRPRAGGGFRERGRCR